MLLRALILLVWLVAAVPVQAPGQSAAGPVPVAERMVFLVPPRLAASFLRQGLRAFDPFDNAAAEAALVALRVVDNSLVSRSRISRRTMHRLRMEKPPAEADGRPCYDLLPVLTARGWKPAPGTTAVYDPGSRLILAAAGTPEDMKVIEAFCHRGSAWWIPEYRSGDGGWDAGSYFVRDAEIGLRVIAVSKSVAEGWKFRPQRPGDLLMVPVSERRELSRQSLLVRSGQRSRLTAQAARPSRGSEIDPDYDEAEEAPHRSNLEVEVNIGDTAIIDLLAAPVFHSAGSDETEPIVAAAFTAQKFDRAGETLIELPCFPGSTERRFMIISAGIRGRGPLEAASRWLGRPYVSASDSGVVGRIFFLRDDSAGAAPPGTGADAVPPVPAQSEPPVPVSGPLAPLFAGMDARDARAEIFRRGGPVVTGDVINCRGILYFRGNREEAEALAAWNRGSAAEAYDPYQALVDALIFSSDRTGSPGPEDPGSRVIARTLFTVRAGQRAMTRTASVGAEPEASGIRVTFEGNRADDGTWTFQPEVLARPPFTAERCDVTIPTPLEHGVMAIGLMKDGRRLFLSWRGIPDPPIASSRPEEARDQMPLLRMWWEQTAGKVK